MEYSRRYDDIIAFQYFKRFLQATEIVDSSSDQTVYGLWIHFVIRMLAFDGDPFKEIFRLRRLLETCRCLSEHHFKTAVVHWHIGHLHEESGLTERASDEYQEAIVIWEELVYNYYDKKAKAALRCMNSEYESLFQWTGIKTDNILLAQKYLQSYSFLLYKRYALFDWRTYDLKCIIHRLRVMKMICIEDLWKFHTELLSSLLDYVLCAVVLDKMLEVCNDKIYSNENGSPLDDGSVIGCFEFISHWYFTNNKFNESLLYRQYQLELEYKKFPAQHPTVGWSLWFIGLIFYGMNEDQLSLGYLTRASKIFDQLHPKDNPNIEMLEKHISQTKRVIHNIDTSRIEIYSETNPKRNDKVNFNASQHMPRLLKIPFHLD
jgi:hypothetical protein